MEKDPTTWALGTWSLALGMSFAGGLVNWFGKVKHGKSRVFNIVELIGEVFTSGFVGIGVFMLAQSLDQSVGASAALAGVTAHMATRLLFLIENGIEKKLARESE